MLLTTKKKEKTALADQHFLKGHAINFNNTTVLDREANFRKRHINDIINIKIEDHNVKSSLMPKTSVTFMKS